MAYGKLGLIKAIGEKLIFCILDEKGHPTETIPDVTDWLMKRLGHTVSFTLSDIYWQVCDIDRKREEGV